MLLSNVYKHTAFPGWNLKLFSPSKISQIPHNDDVYQRSLLLKQQEILLWFYNAEESVDRNNTHGNHGDNSESQHGKTLKETVRFAKYPPAMEQSDNCKRHTAGTHQNIAHSQSYNEHVGDCSQPVVSVHGVKSEKISEDSHNISKSKQNCFSPN